MISALQADAPAPERAAGMHAFGRFDGSWDLDVRWLGPVRGLVIPFIARETPSGVELLGTREPDVRLRWSFSAITPTTFTWRNEEIRGADGAWELKQEFGAVRRAQR